MNLKDVGDELRQIAEQHNEEADEQQRQAGQARRWERRPRWDGVVEPQPKGDTVKLIRFHGSE